MTPTEELRDKLDELGVRWWPDVYYRDTNTCWRVGDFEWRASEKKDGKLLIGCTCVKYLTPEQAIAATVGERYYTYDEWRAINEAVGDAMEYAHEHAVMYHDKADPLWNIDEYVNRVLKVAYGTKDATLGRCDTMGLWPEWEQVLFANVSDEVAQDNLNECVHDLLDKAATVGRSCASCPEMDNPDSYIMHLHRALEVADRGAGTCHLEECEHEREIPYNLPDCDGGWYTEVTYDCDECGYENTDPNIRFCGGCGRKVVSE